MRDNNVKRTLAQGGVALGTMVFEFNTTGIARIAADAGAEFVIFDHEHIGWNVETLRLLFATTGTTGIVPMVRVPTTHYHHIARPLDMGAMGIMVPMVENEEQARAIVRFASYPPVGRRGAAFGFAHDDYRDGEVVDKIQSANRELLLIAQIETAAGLENVERIAAVAGLDVLWIGHFDLTNSLGIPGQFAHPAYLAAVERVVAACRRQNKAAGFMASSIDEGRALIKQGFRILALGNDVMLYKQALRTGLEGIRRSD